MSGRHNRPPKTGSGHRDHRLRAQIASAAARLMAEDGISDHTQAKRKAARQLGLPEGAPLPDNAEVDAELRTYHLLYQGEEQTRRITDLRRKAVAVMEVMQPFNPYLAGSVLEGTAGRFAEIDIQLFPDSAKDVEIFLLGRGTRFDHVAPRNDRAEAVLALDWDGDTVNLVIYDPDDERVVFRHRDGRPRERARIDAVAALLPRDEINE